MWMVQCDLLVVLIEVETNLCLIKLTNLTKFADNLNDKIKLNLIKVMCDRNLFCLYLTHCDLLEPYVDRNLSQYWFMLPDGISLSSEPSLTSPELGFVSFASE